MKIYSKIYIIISSIICTIISIEMFRSTALFIDANNISFSILFFLAEWLRIFSLASLIFLILIPKEKFINLSLVLSLYALISSVIIYTSLLVFINNNGFMLLDLYIRDIEWALDFNSYSNTIESVPIISNNTLLMYLDIIRILLLSISSFLIFRVKKGTQT